MAKKKRGRPRLKSGSKAQKILRKYWRRQNCERKKKRKKRRGKK